MAAVAPIVGVVSAAASVAGTVAGMSAQKKQAKASQDLAEQQAQDTKAYNEDSLKLLEEQQRQTREFRDASHADTRRYTLEKGLRTLAEQRDMGWERLSKAASQLQAAVNLTAKQQGETAGLAQRGYLLKESQLGERNRLEEELTGRTIATDLAGKAALAMNELGAIAEKTAATKKELALRDDFAVNQHVAAQAGRALEQRLGVGRVVASEAARGVTGGAATAARLIGRQLTIQQSLDDAKLKLDRGLYALAGAVADQERARAEASVRLGFDRERSLGALQIEGMQRGNRLAESQMRAGNDLAYAGLLQEQAHGLERMSFDANRQIESQYLDYSLGLRAGMVELNTRIADIDFEHGQNSAQAAMNDAFRMENAQLSAKHNIADATQRNAYAQTMGNIQSSAATWQGLAGISSSLFSFANAVTPLFPSQQPAYGGSYGATGAGRSIVGSTGMMGGGV